MLRRRVPDWMGEEDYLKQLKHLPKECFINFLNSREAESKTHRIIIFSDSHGVLVDPKARDCFFSVVRNNHFDEIVGNGDLLDFPFLSNHAKKMDKELHLFDNYSEVKEIEQVKEEMLKPLRHFAPDAHIVFRLGNHDERVTAPKSYNHQQQQALIELYQHYETNRLDKMLDLEALNIEYDPSPARNYQNKFYITHGLSLAKNAPRKNIGHYGASGTTGHTHRLGSDSIGTMQGVLTWVESGCLRHLNKVEYMATGVVADWAQGFVVVDLYTGEDGEVKVFANNYRIDRGECFYAGKLHSYRDLGGNSTVYTDMNSAKIVTWTN